MRVPQPAADVRPLPIARGLAMIFDLDGVVIDSMPMHAVVWKKYLDSIGASGRNLAAMHGRKNRDILREFLGPEADERALFEHGAAKERLFREIMQDHIIDYLVPGIEIFLSRVQNTPIAVASNAERANIDFVLDGANLRKYFDVIVDGDQVEHPKPAPDIYLHAAEQLGFNPRDCIVFEDSPVGIAAASAAGTRPVGILTHLPHLDDVQFAAADFLDPRLESWIARQQVH